MRWGSVLKKFELNDLLYLMARLREPEFGCPWDLKQDYLSITPSTIEEAYEVVDAIELQDYGHLKEELGDLLFQIVFYCQLGQEDGYFDFSDIIQAITEKLLRRHPHVFPEGTLESKRTLNNAASEEKIKASWDAIKRQEREAKGSIGILDDVPKALPGLIRAEKLQKRAAQVGFDWKSPKDVVLKLDEEVLELKDAIESGNLDAIKDELGDVLFSCVNIARHLKLEPEQTVRQANTKFENRFRTMEDIANSQGLDLANIDELGLEALWQEAKKNG